MRRVAMMMLCWAVQGCSDGGTGDPVCQAGDFRVCPCPQGGEGLRVCLDDGNGFGTCDCGDVQSQAPAAQPMSVSGTADGGSGPISSASMQGMQCGNGTCDADLGETCAGCADDCGECGSRSDAGGDAGVEPTCGRSCVDDSDCAPPRTTCLGSNLRCIPQECQGCFDNSQFCCWCDTLTCSDVSCVPNSGGCPPCS